MLCYKAGKAKYAHKVVRTQGPNPTAGAAITEVSRLRLGTIYGARGVGVLVAVRG